MNDSEAIRELKSRLKPHIGIMPQSTFSSTIIRFEAGLLKPKTVAEFLEKFYLRDNDGLWKLK